MVRERTQRADDRRQCLDEPRCEDGQCPAKPLGEDGKLRTAKPCGSGTRCWCQADGGMSNPTGFRQAFNPSATVTRRIRRRGEHGISRKATAQGMPECSDCTCMLVCVFFAHFAHETAGAASTRHSLRPLFFGRICHQQLGRIVPRDCGVVFSGGHVIVTSHAERWIASAFARRATADKSLRSQ